MLIILVFVFLLSLGPTSNYSTSSDDSTYEENGVIEDIGRIDDRYFIIVRFEHDGEVVRKSIDISYSQFISYREDQPITIRVENNSYYIIVP